MFDIEIKTDNATFDDAPGAEMARILRQIAEHVKGYTHADEIAANIRDINGNTCGATYYLGRDRADQRRKAQS